LPARIRRPPELASFPRRGRVAPRPDRPASCACGRMARCSFPWAVPSSTRWATCSWSRAAACFRRLRHGRAAALAGRAVVPRSGRIRCRVGALRLLRVEVRRAVRGGRLAPALAGGVTG
jgi:hypothetical protein